MYARDLPLHRARGGSAYSRRLLSRKQVKAAQQWGRMILALVLGVAVLLAVVQVRCPANSRPCVTVPCAYASEL